MDIDWPFIMSHMKDFVEKFTPEQVREAPSTCKGQGRGFLPRMVFSGKVIFNPLVLFSGYSLWPHSSVYRDAVSAKKGTFVCSIFLSFNACPFLPLL